MLVIWEAFLHHLAQPKSSQWSQEVPHESGQCLQPPLRAPGPSGHRQPTAPSPKAFSISTPMEMEPINSQPLQPQVKKHQIFRDCS